jgi:uncharacterized damage-inducible protein DinB
MARVQATDQDELIERFRQDVKRLLAAVDQLPPTLKKAPILGEWTLKDVLAHVAAWDRELLSAVDQLLAGKRPGLIGYRESDFNAGVIAATRSASLTDILREARAANRALLRRLRQLPSRRWRALSSHRRRDGRAISVASLCEYTYQGGTHYAGHAAQIEAAARQGPS